MKGRGQKAKGRNLIHVCFVLRDPPALREAGGWVYTVNIIPCVVSQANQMTLIASPAEALAVEGLRLFPIAYCPLPTAHCLSPLPSALCLLPSALCLLP
ncbi:hypothetical protein A4H97_22685 [Niastella yeongjuensis]|uniref:Uncharacterized protein n=1 Tax=Niastella yeongjuensis TaxID=354355 RepID=A0A1V9F7K4_9BACT|nr:hypothetical protein A4H97_22685 [Niastella yeongjuensis]